MWRGMPGSDLDLEEQVREGVRNAGADAVFRDGEGGAGVVKANSCGGGPDLARGLAFVRRPDSLFLEDAVE